MRARVKQYTTTLPTARPGGRRTLGSTASVVLHVVIIALVLYRGAQPDRKHPLQDDRTPDVQPIALDFAPPRPTPTPRVTPPPSEAPPPPQAQLPPAIPLSPGPDQTPGGAVKVVPNPEPDPNAAPNTQRTEATRPDPGSEDQSTDGPTDATAAPNANTPALDARPAPTALETEARRIFGRPSSRLGPLAGTRDNRPWESSTESDSRGCEVTEEDEPQDPSVPKGMAVIAGRIYREGSTDPLPGARLQILGTPYGAFANDQGFYRLLFDRKLVNRCRTQSVRVTAPGYRGRDVLLYIGDTPNGDVPLSRF